MPSNHLILCCPFLLLPSIVPSIRVFSMCQLFASGGWSTAASASASVLPMNIHGWFPLGLTGLTSLQSKGLSRVFSSTTIQKHQFFNAQPSLWSNSHIQPRLLKNHSFDYMHLCQHNHQRRQWHPTPVLLPGKSHGRRSLAGYRRGPCSRKELNTT